MAWNGSGNFQRTNGSFSGSAVWEDDANAGFDIVDSRHDTHDQDLAQGINNCLTKDGQNSPTADLNMNTFKHTNVGNGTARNHYATIGQLQDEGVRALSSVGGTANAITATTIPSISGYVTGAQYTFRAVATNSGATTLKIGTAPAVDIQRNVAALVGGEIVNGRHYTVVYDGSVFQLLNTTANPLFLDSVNNRVGVGTAVPLTALTVAGNGVAGGVSDSGSKLATLRVSDFSGLSNNGGAIEFGAGYGSYAQSYFSAIKGLLGSGSGNSTGDLAFYTRNATGDTSLTERMRIDSAGKLLFRTTVDNTSTPGLVINPAGGATEPPYLQFVKTFSGTRNVLLNWHNGTYVGGVDMGNTATVFATSSDYRLKENIVEISNSLERVAALKPIRFNFKLEPSETIDGFLAHEVAEVVPNAVSGEKDAVKEDGSIKVQALDHSKLIPLLTAAIQELSAKLDDLTDRVMALEV